MGSAVLDAVLASQPLRLSLDEYESVFDQLAAAQRQRDAGVAAAQRLIDKALGTPSLAKRLWQGLLRVPPGSVHELRDSLEKTLRSLVGIIDFTVDHVIPKAKSLNGQSLAGAERLPAARAELVAFVDMIFSRWTSQEDLEELMAETFELPSWLTNGPIPPHLQPPQSWYDETIDPTKPADA